MIPHLRTSLAWRRLASEFEMGSGACDCSMVLSVCDIKFSDYVPEHRFASGATRSASVRFVFVLLGRFALYKDAARDAKDSAVDPSFL